MTTLSELTKASGGSGLSRSGKETYRTMSASQTTLTTADYNNKSDAPYILKSTNAQARDRMPDGAATNDYWHVEVHPDSEPYVLEGATAQTNNRRNIVAVLYPGAKGFFQWDGTEWWWHGNEAVHWWPWELASLPQITLLSPSVSWSRFGAFAIHDEGILVVGSNTGTPRALQAQFIPIDENGVVGTPGTEVTFAGTNNLHNSNTVRAFPIASNIWLIVWHEETSNHTESIVCTLSGTNTLTLASAEHTLNTSSSDRQYYTVVPIRAQYNSTTPAFIVVNTLAAGGPDTAAGPEVAYCTISGTGAGATITRNTGVTFSNAGASCCSERTTCIEDPDNAGVFWLIGADDDGGTNTEGQLTRFTIVGTTPTLGAQYDLPVQYTRNANDTLSIDHKDNNIVARFATTEWYVSLSLGSGAPSIRAATQNGENHFVVNGVRSLTHGIQYGGVNISSSNDQDANMFARWMPKSMFAGGSMNIPGTDTEDHNLYVGREIPVPISKGAMATHASTTAFTGSSDKVITVTSGQKNSEMEDHGMFYTVSLTGANEGAYITTSQIPSATRYRSAG